MSGVIFNDGKFQGVGNDGKVVPYGKLYFYECCSGNAKQTYTDSKLSSTNTHPVILSASGKADVFVIEGSYDVVLKDKNDVTVWTINNFIPATGGASSTGVMITSEWREDYIAVQGQTVFPIGREASGARVYVNGSLLTESYDYTTSGATVTLAVARTSGDEVSILGGELLNGAIAVYVDTISDLTTIDTAKTTAVSVGGYNAINDGGGGIFHYDTTLSATNDYGVIINGWVRQFTGAIKPEWFGAYSNADISDKLLTGDVSGEAIQRALNYASTVDAELYCTGVIKIERKIVIPANISMRGNAIFYRWLDADLEMFKNGYADATAEEYGGNGNIIIEGVTFHGNSIMFGYKVELIEISHGANITISDCDFYENANNNVIKVTGCKDVNILNCGFYGTVKTDETQYSERYPAISLSAASEEALSIPPYDCTPTKNVLISGCYFALGKRVADGGLQSDDAFGRTVVQHNMAIGENSSVRDKYTSLIRIDSCSFKRMTFAAIRPIAWKFVNIVGNEFLDCNATLRLGASYPNTLADCNCADQLNPAIAYCDNGGQGTEDLIFNSNTISLTPDAEIFADEDDVVNMIECYTTYAASFLTGVTDNGDDYTYEPTDFSEVTIVLHRRIKINDNLLRNDMSSGYVGAIVINGFSRSSLSNNTVTGKTTIDVDYSVELNISDNNIHGSTYGLSVQTKNSLNSFYTDGKPITIPTDHFNTAAINLQSNQEIAIHNNTITNAVGNGIYLKNIIRPSVTDNIIENSPNSIPATPQGCIMGYALKFGYCGANLLSTSYADANNFPIYLDANCDGMNTYAAEYSGFIVPTYQAVSNNSTNQPTRP